MATESCSGHCMGKSFLVASGHALAVLVHTSQMDVGMQLGCNTNVFVSNLLRQTAVVEPTSSGRFAKTRKGFRIVHWDPFSAIPIQLARCH